MLQSHHPRAVAVSAAKRQGLDDLQDAVMEMLGADFADAAVDADAGNGKVLAYLAAHAEIYRQEFDGNRVHIRCYLPRQLLHHIQGPGVEVRFLDRNGAASGSGERRGLARDRSESHAIQTAADKPGGSPRTQSLILQPEITAAAVVFRRGRFRLARRRVVLLRLDVEDQFARLVVDGAGLGAQLAEQLLLVVALPRRQEEVVPELAALRLRGVRVRRRGSPCP